MRCCAVAVADGRSPTFPVPPGAGDATCAHPARLEGVCLACGHCEHEIVLNGTCLHCGLGADELDGVARSPRLDLIPADRLKRR